MRIEHLRFQQAVPALVGMTLQDQVPMDGRITQITAHFPNGCNALVDVAVSWKNVQVLPVSGFIALNDTTTQFPADTPVKQDDILTVQINNGDAANPHTITVVVSIQEE